MDMLFAPVAVRAFGIDNDVNREVRELPSSHSRSYSTSMSRSCQVAPKAASDLRPLCTPRVRLPSKSFAQPLSFQAFLVS